MSLRKFTVLSVTLLLAFSAVAFCSCGKGTTKAVENLSDVLRGNYVCDISFRLSGEEEIIGKGQITRNGTEVRLDILTPEPYSGMSIEYDTSGLPRSVAVHFSGMNTSLPNGAVARLNPIASLFADDFAPSLAKVPANNITEYEADGISGLCASVQYGDSMANIYFAADGSVPYRLEVSGDDSDSEIVFDIFKAQETLVS